MERKSNFAFAEGFKLRTKKFALRVMRLVDGLPNTPSCRTAGGQLVRAATSVAANYRAVCRTRSTREFLAKLHIALEEADEAVLLLELLNEGGALLPSSLDDLLAEANEIMIMATLGKAQKNYSRKSTKPTPLSTTNSQTPALPPS